MPTEADILRDNMRLVHYLARGYRGRGMEYDDLVQEGSIGLLHAVRTWDPVNHPGVKFGTYAGVCISGAIRKAVADCDFFRVPAYLGDCRLPLGKARQALGEEGIHSPTDEQLAQAGGLSLFRARALTHAPRPVQLRCHDDSGREIEHGLTEEPDDMGDWWEECQAALSLLEPLERAALTAWLGLAGKPPVSMAAFARRRRTSIYYVRMSIFSALNKIAARIDGAPRVVRTRRPTGSMTRRAVS